MEEPKCRECGANIEEGSVVAFGDGIWHLHCFRCQKCHSMVECDSNLLLLSNGNPICENCSYRCAFCKKEIMDEAIMTGDESYHTECFRCYRCGSRIENLVFAKSVQGICCMLCHNERDAQKKKEATKGIDVPHPIEPQVPQIPPRAESLRSFDTNSHKRTPSYNSSFDVTTSYDQPSDASETDEQLNEPAQNLSLSPSPSETSAHGKSSPPQESSRSHPGTPISSRLSDSRTSRESLSSSASANRALTSLSTGCQNDSVQSLSSLVASPLPRSSSVLPPSNSMPFPSTTDLESFYAAGPSKSMVDESGGVEAMKLYPVAYIEELIADLKDTKSRLIDAESNFNRIKTISIRALEEFNRAKEEFGREVAARQKAEATVRALHENDGRLRAVLKERDELAAQLERVQEEYADARFEQANLEDAIDELMIEKEYLARLLLLAGKASSNGEDEENDGSLSHGANDSLAKDVAPQRNERTKPLSENGKLTEITREFQRMSQLTTAAALESAFPVSPSPSSQSNGDDTANYHRKPVPSEPSFERPTELTIQDPTPDNYKKQPLTPEILDDRNAGPAAGIALQANKVNQSRRYSVEGLSQRTVGETAVPRKFKWMGIMGTKEKEGRDRESKDSKESSGSVHLAKNKSISKSDASISIPSPSGGKKKEAFSLVNRRDHYFQPHTFLRPLKCDLCNEKMWGLQLQAKEMRCYACGYHSHAKCVAHVPPNCPGVDGEPLSAPSPQPVYIDLNNKPRSNGLLGRDLTPQVELEKVPIPLIITSCVAAVEARGMEVEGIYRKSGPASMARSILARFNEHESSKGLDPPPDLLNSDAWPDITAVTSVLKQYLRELPNPLLTFEAYPAFLTAVRGTEGLERVEAFRSIIATFPTPHRNAFCFLLRHLGRVCAKQSVNLMSAKNLAVVFGPTLLRQKTASTDSEMMDMAGKNSAIEFMILHSSQLLNDDLPCDEAANEPVDVPTTPDIPAETSKLPTFLEIPGSVASTRNSRDGSSSDSAGSDARAASPSINSSSDDDDVYLSMSESENIPRGYVDNGYPRTKVGYI